MVPSQNPCAKLHEIDASGKADGTWGLWTDGSRHGRRMGMKDARRPIIVFDLDGTLADTAQDLIATLNAILASEGVEQVPLAKARDLIGAGARPLIERGFALAGRILTEDQLNSLYQAFLAYYHENIAVHTVLFDGVEAALDRLRDEGFPMAVCTNKMESHAVQLLKALGQHDRFAFIAGKDTFPFFKPDPRHLTETIRRSETAATTAIMIGDSKTDIDTAKAAGIPSIGVSFGYTAIPMAALEPDVLIDHFDELHGAIDRIIQKKAV
jgi:phosphoglycolate phosphatase